MCPFLIALAKKPAPLSAGTSYSDAGATATDNVDGDITSRISAYGTSLVSSKVPTPAGTPYVVTYDVSDRAGNRALTATRQVIVACPSVRSLALPCLILTISPKVSTNARETTYSSLVSSYPACQLCLILAFLGFLGICVEFLLQIRRWHRLRVCFDGWDSAFQLSLFKKRGNG